MIDLVDVLRAITEKIEPLGEINDRDLEEGFPRPSFFIDFLDATSLLLGGKYSLETVDCCIYYFSDTIDAGFIDCLEMQGKIKEVLHEGFTLGEVALTPTNVSYNLNKRDKVVSCVFTLDLMQLTNRVDERSNMEELDFHSVVNEEETAPLPPKIETPKAGDMGDLNFNI